MRRKDREITDLTRIDRILQQSLVCRLALCRDNIPYIVPMNYGYSFSDDKHLTLYFHSAKEGKKIDILKNNPKAAFEMDHGLQLIETDVACKFSMLYESVVGVGDVAFCDDPGKKKEALIRLMEHYAPGRAFAFTDDQVENLSIFTLKADHYTAKSNINF